MTMARHPFPPENGARGRSLVEVIISWAMILLMTGIFATHIHLVIIKAKEAVLRNELKNLRLAIMLYEILHKRYPPDLRMLLDKEYNIKPGRGPTLKGKFLKNFKYDERGRLKDPFGKIYLYNQKTGVVKSESKGYQNW